MCSIGKLKQIIYLTSNEWRHFLKSLPVILLLNIKTGFFHFLFAPIKTDSAGVGQGAAS